MRTQELFYPKITRLERLWGVMWEEARQSIGLNLENLTGRSASFKLPYNVREEWALKHGLDVFTSIRYEDALEAVTERIGVSTSAVEHNVANHILLDGCEKIGLPFSTIPQNTRGEKHNCASCTFGCPTGVKQSSGRFPVF